MARSQPMTQADGAAPSSRSQSRVVQLIAVIVLMLAVPLAIRLVHGGSADASSRVPYLPAFPGHRSRPFHAARIPELQQMNPGAVVIGDSMAGTRIDERVLVAVVGRAGGAAAPGRIGVGVLVSRAQELGRRQRHQAARGLHLLSRHQPDRRDVPARRAVPLVARHGRRATAKRSSTPSSQAALDGPLYAVHRAVERVYQVDAGAARGRARGGAGRRRRGVARRRQAGPRFSTR